MLIKDLGCLHVSGQVEFHPDVIRLTMEMTDLKAKVSELEAAGAPEAAKAQLEARSQQVGDGCCIARYPAGLHNVVSRLLFCIA